MNLKLLPLLLVCIPGCASAPEINLSQSTGLALRKPSAVQFECSSQNSVLQDIFKGFNTVLIGETHSFSPEIAGTPKALKLLNEICGTHRPTTVLIEGFQKDWQLEINKFLKGEISFDEFDSKVGFTHLFKYRIRVDNYGGLLKMAKDFGWNVQAIELDDMSDKFTVPRTQKAIQKINSISFVVNGNDLKPLPGVRMQIEADWFRVQGYAEDLIREYSKRQENGLVLFFGGSEHLAEIAGLISDEVPLQNVATMHLGTYRPNFPNSPVEYETPGKTPYRKFKFGERLNTNLYLGSSSEDISFWFAQKWKRSSRER